MKSQLGKLLALGAIMGSGEQFPNLGSMSQGSLLITKGNLTRYIHAGHLKQWNAYGWKSERQIQKLNDKRRRRILK